MKLSRELKTAFIVITGVILFILGYSYLKSSTLFDTDNQFFAVYSNVGGLQKGTTVSLRGKSIGKVEDVRFINNYKELLVVLRIDDEVTFSRNSSVQLFSNPLSGVGIQILQTFDGAELAKDGDTLTTKKKVGLMDKLEPLQDNLDSAIGSADSLLNNFNDLMDAQTKAAFRSSLASMQQTMKNMERASLELNSLLTSQRENINQSLSNVGRITENFASISDSLKAADLGNTASQMQLTVRKLNTLLAKIEKGEGSLGKLTKDEQLYENIEGATRELELLLQDFRLNPKRYVNVSVFGKKQKSYELPENDPAKTQNQD